MNEEELKVTQAWDSSAIVCKKFSVKFSAFQQRSSIAAHNECLEISCDCFI